MRQSLETVKKATSAKDGGNRPVLFSCQWALRLSQWKDETKVCFHSGVNELAVFNLCSSSFGHPALGIHLGQTGPLRMEYNPQ